MPPIALAPTPTRAQLEEVRVRDLMTSDPVSVRDGVSVRDAATFLADRGVGAALVVNDAGRAVGVISRSDVLLAVEAGVDGAPVREVMSPAVIAVQPDASAVQAAEVMIRCMVRRVFVVDGDGTAVGVVSTADLFRALKTIWAGRQASPPGTRTAITRRVRAMTARHPLPPAATARDLMREITLEIPSGMSVGAAASLLAAAGTSVAPVVDSGGRCVGLFGAADYRRWLEHGRTRAEVVTEWQTVPPAAAPDEVGYHMTRRFAVATPEAGVHELVHRLHGVGEPYLVVLDRQRRPRGIVCALDVVVAEAGASPCRPAGGRCGKRQIL